MWREFKEKLVVSSLVLHASTSLRSVLDKPKGPSHTKFSAESKLGTGREVRYGGSKTLRKVLGSAPFPKEKGQENGTDGKRLQQ